MKTNQGTERMTNGMIALIRVGGNAPDCPACGNSNAMLNDAVEYNGVFRWGFKCRDCGFRLDEGEASIREFSSYANAKIAIDEGLFDADYPSAEISDEAIMIGNMVTLYLEAEAEARAASKGRAIWKKHRKMKNSAECEGRELAYDLMAIRIGDMIIEYLDGEANRTLIQISLGI